MQSTASTGQPLLADEATPYTVNKAFLACNHLQQVSKLRRMFKALPRPQSQ